MNIGRSSDYRVLKKAEKTIALLDTPKTRYQIATALGCHPKTALRLLERLRRLKMVRTTARPAQGVTTFYIRGRKP